MSRNIPTHTSTSHTRNSLLHIRPLRFSRNSHISNIINVQSTIASAQSSSSTLLTIPLEFIDRLESGPNGRRNDRNLQKPTQNELTYPQQSPRCKRKKNPYLRIKVQIPYIKLSQPIYTGPNSRMTGMPLDIIHIIIRLLKRINRRKQMTRSRRFSQTLRPPQFDRPVHRTCQKQIRKIHRPH